MSLLSPVPLQTRDGIGLVLVALWLGWLVAVLPALGTRAPADPGQVATTVEQLLTLYPELPRGRPLAILLSGCSCPSDADSPAWQRMRQGLEDLDGYALPLTTAVPANFQMLVLDAEGQPVYAGPLQPPLSVCGRIDARVSQWLPALLDGQQPPLHLPSPCSCQE